MEKNPKPIEKYDFDVDALWDYLTKIFDERIVVLDGGMGTQLQTYKLEEQDYRGTVEEFLKCPKASSRMSQLPAAGHCFGAGLKRCPGQVPG